MLKTILASIAMMVAAEDSASLLQLSTPSNAKQNLAELLGMFEAIAAAPVSSAEMLSALPMDHRVALWERAKHAQIPKTLIQKFKAMPHETKEGLLTAVQTNEEARKIFNSLSKQHRIAAVQLAKDSGLEVEHATLDKSEQEKQCRANSGNNDLCSILR